MYKWPAQRDVRASQVITRAELLAGGMSRSAISRRLQNGTLTVRYPGVYSHGPGDLSRETAWMAALLACGNGALLNDLSAAAILDVTRWPEGAPHVLVPRRPA